MMKNKITFICIGAQKAGTTTLHNILKQHSNIFLPDKKEIPFFHNEITYKKGFDWWINKNFSKRKLEKEVGVINPEYLYHPNVPEKILKHLGKEIKIIIIIRDPVERAYSHFLMNKRRGIENLNFIDALKTEKQRMEKNKKLHRKHFSYIDRGKYYNQIMRYLTMFDKEKFLFLSFEKDIKKNRELTVKKIENFLKLNHENINIDIKSNASKKAIFPLLNKIIFTKNSYIKFLAKIFLSKKMKNNIATFIYNNNIKKFEKIPLEKNIKKELMSKYFEQDYLKTLKLLR